MRLPKPVYEGLPFFLIAVGAVFIYLFMRQYEYAATLFFFLLGVFCIIAGAGLIIVRILYRRAARADAATEYDDD